VIILILGFMAGSTLSSDVEGELPRFDGSAPPLVIGDALSLVATPPYTRHKTPRESALYLAGSAFAAVHVFTFSRFGW
jgi:hypothetical protein